MIWKGIGMKKLGPILMALMLFFPNISYAVTGITIYIDGQSQSFAQPPIIKSGTTLVPLRGVFEKLGATVDWNGKTRTVTTVKNSTTIILKIGSTKPTVNGKVTSISIPAQIIKNSTMVPLRFVSEALGANVNWNGTKRTITINSKIVAYDIVLNFPVDRYPQTAAHIKAAIARGESSICTIDRGGADENREESLAGIPTKDGFDRDEWPMALCSEGGKGTDVAYVESSDNRGSGSWIGNQLQRYPNGTRVLFVLKGNLNTGSQTALPQPLIPVTPTPSTQQPSVVGKYRGLYDPFGIDRNCSDFVSQAEAQAFFIAAGGPKNDRHRLDGDGNGLVCESLK